ncbi:hypothetical protein [Actinoalloteichus hymeniacidonis]|uniref:Uncharacterized protein n=1 Tax=Actinoalloteichus hymeniacidonis TaxID=340345 RepID=A0AAC9HRY8_9PSEU|nr:hypothetical protein [Actinoalloteichus hymeniacidonis]AOS64557.1 hypothetical protein TL08_18830 [Actinoalloteichus hymeniacidonis]MBB5907371.1 hypothetical protein [Actinoalloteichus hymeniacidonis]
MTGDHGIEDGRTLRPFRRREVLHRSVYSITHDGPNGLGHTWTVDIDMGQEDGGWDAELYLDGIWQAKREMPAEFAIPGGRIEVNAGMYGVTRVHLVRDSGVEQRMKPARGTAEDLRFRLQRRNPTVSRWIGGAAIVVLLVNLVLVVPRAIELITSVPRIAELVGTFESPIVLPDWLSVGLLVAGILAAVERTLTLRHNAIIDAETNGANE